MGCRADGLAQASVAFLSQFLDESDGVLRVFRRAAGSSTRVISSDEGVEISTAVFVPRISMPARILLINVWFALRQRDLG